MMKRDLYHTINKSQDGSPLSKFYDKSYELKDAEVNRIHNYARPSVGDNLNLLLVGIIEGGEDLETIKNDLDYAARQLRAARDAIIAKIHDQEIREQLDAMPSWDNHCQ